MADLIRRLLGRLTGFEWRLYFVRKGVGLEYALHNKDGWALLGYLHAKFCDSGERISYDWKLYLGYYTGSPEEEHFQLTEAMFTDAEQFATLIAKCRALDKNFDKDAAGWNPTFVHVPTRKRLPLGGPTGTDRESITKYIEHRLEAGSDDEISFSQMSNEVFVR